MATVEATKEPLVSGSGIGWDGQRLDEMLLESERLFAQTGHYAGLERLELMESDPIGYEKLFSRIRGGLVSARETALNISASPIVRELGELCFALYSPEGDSLALSTGIIVHVHTMSDAIKWMVRRGYEDNPGIRPGDIFAKIFSRRGLHLNAYNAYQSIIRGGHTFLTIRTGPDKISNTGDTIDLTIEIEAILQPAA